MKAKISKCFLYQSIHLLIKWGLSFTFIRNREKRQICQSISKILSSFYQIAIRQTTLTKHRTWCWGSLLLLLPAAEHFWCSTTPSCGPLHSGRRQPAGTTPASPPQCQSSCTQTPCSPALGKEREEGRWWGKGKGGEKEGVGKEGRRESEKRWEKGGWELGGSKQGGNENKAGENEDKRGIK